MCTRSTFWLSWLFLDERSTGMLEDSLGSMIMLKSALADDYNLPWSLDVVWLTEEEVAYWGLSNDVLFTRELPSIREMIIFFLLLNHWGLMLTPPSRGFYQTLLGKFCFATLKGATFVPCAHEGVRLWYWIYLGFSWWSWLMKECPWWFLVHWGILDAFDPLGNDLDAFNPLGMLLMYVNPLGIFLPFCINCWTFVCTSSLLGTPWRFLIFFFFLGAKLHVV